MEDKVGVIMINQSNCIELQKECIAGAKAQKCSIEKKAAVVGGDYFKSQLINKGLEIIGEVKYVIIINTNEELKENYIEKCLSIFKSYDSVAAVYTDYNKEYLSDSREYLPSFNKLRIAEGYQIPTTAMFKKEIFNICGNFDDTLKGLETWDMWIRISEKFPIYHLPESLYVSKSIIKKSLTMEELVVEQKYILDKATQRTNGNK